MKICFVIGALKYSGAEKIFSILIEKLKSQFDVSVMLLACEKPYQEVEGVTQVPLYISEEKYTSAIHRIMLRVKKMRNLIEENRYDVLVSVGVQHNLDAILAGLGTGTHIILCERNDPNYDPVRYIQRLRRDIFYRFADGFVFQTEEIKNFFPECVRKKAYIIPNFVGSQKNREIYNPLYKTICTSARLDDYQKDQKTLILAFSMFHEKHKEYYLEFYGDGPDKSILEQYAKELGIDGSVRFLGKVDNPISYIAKSEMFVLTSRFEGMPNALIEAMSIGAPCISSDCGGGGAKALIQNGINGMLFNVGDASTLSEIMNDLAEHAEKRKELGHNAYSINDTLSCDVIVEKWEKLLLSYLNA